MFQTTSTDPESNRKTVETGKIDSTLYDKVCKCLAAGGNH